MAKRDRGFTTIEEGPPKRRKAEEAGSDADMAAVDEYAADEEEREEESLEDKALKLWQTVKDAMKDGRPLSLQFLKRPNPRTYPDYYAIIRNPIALEDIKKKITSGQYTDLESVRKDFELCFNNAKDYNLQESIIFNDAKDLLKLANKTYRKLMPSEHGENDKPPSMKRLLNSRIQKVMKKTDDNGRILSTMFMELPSKKLWPVYYKQIQEPRCLETIQKQVKQKEYKSAAEFAADVELVFSNALAFNMEHTQIWEDAITLRDYFRQLMADLPLPYALPQYAHTPKIKIKMSTAQSTAPAPPPVEELVPTSTLPLISLRVPAPVKPAVSKPFDVKAPSPKPSTPTPSVTAAALSSSATHPTTRPHKASKVSKTFTSRTPQSGTPQPILQLHPTMSVYGNNTLPKPKHPSYMQPTPPPAPSAAAALPSYIASLASTSVPTPTPVLATPPPPSPIIPPYHQLRHVTLRTEPRGRHLKLDQRDGVTSWAMPLERDEKNLSVQEISFMAEAGDTSGEEDEGEDDTAEMDVDAAPEPGPLKKRRGRPPKIAKAVTPKPKISALPKKRKPKKRSEIVVKVNGNAVKEEGERSGTWTVELTVGRNVVEVGEQGGLIWKVYAERIG
ncbi:RSC complex protein [Lentinula detonsa]|uniref:RSC complex protein n=1 Tax=Lentinula detonsa TaxID=2804962 RepID=A0AA38PZT5_9AGAR|nr:RSC complex protein [Lentinula detonsa]